MKFGAIKPALVAGAVAGAIFALAGTASASHVLVEVAVPEQAAVGNAAAVQVSLRSADDGLAVANAPVVFYTDASFGGVSGEVELGRAVTDENGVATLNYQPRSAGEHEVRVEYVTPGDSEPEVAATSITVVGASQLHRSTAGVQVPGLNVWLIIALVTGVWAILFSVGLRVVAIARAGSDETVPERALRPREAKRQVTATTEAGTSEV